ncbi:ATP-dependent nuclease [Cellvibrio sp. NN19]|uniref:ATP-dependent nuclease n=1 Tax=Cellvibrio chitinivorans TaxID=3102792 RepID=UPI002B413C55|nr:AAA family ATPase [Cellvibrio sp. NN19]
MHLISEMEIINFKSCKNLKIKLEGFSPLVGYNNAGKTNILKAIDALVKGKAIGEDGFNDITQPLIIRAELTGLNDEVLSHLSAPQRSSLQPYIENDCIHIQFKQDGLGKTALTLGVRAPSDQYGEWVNPNGIPQAISTLFPEPTFINSMEDAAEDVSKFKAGNTIGKLISNLQKEILKTKLEELSTALSAVGKKLNLNGSERLQELSDFDGAINAKIGDFFPGIELHVDIPTPEISDLFKQGTIKVSERGNSNTRDFSSMGHGAQRAIQMTLIRHLSEITKDITKEGKTNLLLIDEPELFLHPQAIEQIRSSLKILAKKGYQVIFSTHSPFMIEPEDIPITNIVRKHDEGTKVEARLTDAIETVLGDHDAQARLLFDTYNLGQILFSDMVLIAEGDTEKHVLPSLFKAISGKSLGESRLALVIATGAGNIPGMLNILKEMKIPAKALADLDFAFTAAKKQNLIAVDNEDINACLDIIAKMQPTHGFELQGRLPKNSSSHRASDIYELLAGESDALNHLCTIRDELKTKSIWIWSAGAIEPHLCLEAKTTGEWFKFKQKLAVDRVEDVVHDLVYITDFVNWCQEP